MLYQIEASESTPSITLDELSSKMVIEGESYPEDVFGFYGPAMKQLNSYLQSGSVSDFTCDMKFVYFNSSTARVIMQLVDKLETFAKSGINITINWYFDEDDDHMEELGEEYAEESKNVTFNLVSM